VKIVSKSPVRDRIGLEAPVLNIQKHQQNELYNWQSLK
jgi:hypothetical protein